MRLKNILTLLGLAFTVAPAIGATDSALTAFTTGGHTVYHMKTGKIGGKKVLFSATYDGTVLCHDTAGGQVWQTKVNDYFPFDIDAADIDGDGSDEVFVATASGGVDAYDSNGDHMWRYENGANMFQVLPAQLPNGEWRIFTGGVNEALVELSAAGKEIKSYPMKDVVRTLVLANTESSDQKSLVVATVRSGLGGGLALNVINLKNMKCVRRKTYEAKDFKSKLYSIVPVDIDGDNLDELIGSGGWSGSQIVTFDNDLAPISSKMESPKISYRMTFIFDVKLNGEHFILGQYGGYLHFFGLDGSLKRTIKTYADYTNAYFDQETTTLYIGSSSSGGDGIYAFDMSNPEWEKAFAENKYIGRMKEVNDNLAILNEQIRNFERPAYQKPQRDFVIFGNKHNKTDYPNITFCDNGMMTEQFPANREGVLWCRDVDKRMPHNKTQEEILDYARKNEAKKRPFVMRATHGSAMYMSLETMEKIIDVAPNYFIGFVLTEMEKIDDNMKEVVEEIINPLAEYCAQSDKKLLFWNKNIFWCGSCYFDFWQKLLFNPKYEGVFIPALEETNSRTQELSLAGNTGLWMTNRFSSWCARIVSDNTSFDRMWEWGSQHNPSYYYRQISLNATYGASSFFTDVNQGEVGVHLRDQLAPLHELLSKGVVVIPDPEDMLSISPLCLGMTAPPAAKYLKHGKNGHGYSYNEDDHAPMIFDRMDSYFGGAEMLDHDFSKYGYGCDRRQYNFLPRLPYGMIPIVPDYTKVSKKSTFQEMVKIDGESFYDAKGRKRGAVEYKDEMIKKMEKAAEKMLVRVEGPVSWSAVKVDENHIRILLVDPGYTSPAPRDAVVKFQHIKALSCRDILSGESLDIKDGKVSLTVPAGVLRVIDVEI